MIFLQKQLFAGSLLIVMSGIASCTMAQSDRTSSQLAEATVSDAGETNAADVQDSETSTTAKLTLLEALAIAEGAVGDTKVYAMEQEIEDNKPVVEVELGDYEVLVHAETGEIVLLENLRENGDPEDLEEINEAAELVQFAAITIQEALEAAEASAGGNAHTVELDNEEGNLVYEVTVGRDVIYVDAGNGDVLSTIVIGQGGDSEESEWQSSVQVPYDESDSEEDD